MQKAVISFCCPAACTLITNSLHNLTSESENTQVLVVNQTKICCCCCGAGTLTTSASCQTAGWPSMSSWASSMPSMEPPCRPPASCRPPWTATPSSMLWHREEALKACQAPGELFVMFCCLFCIFCNTKSIFSDLGITLYLEKKQRLRLSRS